MQARRIRAVLCPAVASARWYARAVHAVGCCITRMAAWRGGGGYVAFLGCRYHEFFVWMVNRGAVPLAIVRAPATGGAPHPYVYSNPRPTAAVQRYDMVLGCAPAGFVMQTPTARTR